MAASATGQPIAERAMIESIEFTNFKALRATTLPLAPFTLLLGPNGSGKSTVLQAIHGMALGCQRKNSIARSKVLSVSCEDRNAPVTIKVMLRSKDIRIAAIF